MNMHEEIAEEAAKWMILLSEGELTKEQHQQLLEWKKQSPEHEVALENLIHLMDRLRPLQEQHIKSNHALLQQHIIKKKNRSNPVGLSLGLILLTCSLYMVPWHNWTSDIGNGAQSWQSYQLTDNSQIQVAGHTHYNIEFSSQERRIKLRDGNILVDVSKDKHRPFIVEAGKIKIRALGTRFIVQHYDDFTAVTMLESKTRIDTVQQSAVTLSAGESLYIENAGNVSKQNIHPELLQQAWRQKKLVIQDMPLDQVLNILSSYQNRHFIYNKKQMQQKKVTAVLPLDNIDMALKLLEKQIGIEVKNYSVFLTIIKIQKK